jgi:IS5 family transposase
MDTLIVMHIEKTSPQSGLFDYLERVELLASMNRPLDRLNEVIDWERFRPVLESQLSYGKSPKRGRPAKDPVLMLKVCVLQYFHNLSDDETEFQILDRISFQRFLGLDVGGRVPDAKTLWLFKERLGSDGIKVLFDLFNQMLAEHGLIGKSGRIVDATIVSAPVQRNTREQNQAIREGQRPESFEHNPAVGRQKDTDASWTCKHGKHYFGYKNHTKVDLHSKFILDYRATSARVHDSRVIGELVEHSDGTIYADAAYTGEAIEQDLESKGLVNHIHEKARRGHPLNEYSRQMNQLKSRLRARVEHVFGWHAQRGMDRFRGIGLQRAKRAIGMFNWIYNLFRAQYLLRLRAAS